MSSFKFFFLVMCAILLSACSSNNLEKVPVTLDVNGEKKLDAGISYLLGADDGVYAAHDFKGYDQLLLLSPALTLLESRVFEDFSTFIKDEKDDEVIRVFGDYKNKFVFNFIKKNDEYTFLTDKDGRPSAYYTEWHFSDETMIKFSRGSPVRIYRLPSFEQIKEIPVLLPNYQVYHALSESKRFLHIFKKDGNNHKVIDLNNGVILSDGYVAKTDRSEKVIGAIKLHNDIIIIMKNNKLVQLDERGNLIKTLPLQVSVESLGHVGGCLSIGTVDGHIAFINKDLSTIYVTQEVHNGWVSHVTTDQKGVGYSAGVDRKVVSWPVPKGCLLN
ncbi:hypothetical protein GCE9029_01364 [Grimontia celer]|uniref:Lipoprotein n=1 Tax=Grimontia celer TaxID=1796497 RepID=A0A128EZ37_9GAMM|nr:hypothetical protein [Grimontia celer]CZF79266.1 hypothetical protein GCE9029_01364 [Grimontia celer]